MPTSFTYALSAFPNQKAHAARLHEEVAGSAVTVAIDRVDVGADCSIYFKANIDDPSADKTALDDVVAAVRPRRAEVTGVFNPRGGISITVTATYPPAKPPFAAN